MFGWGVGCTGISGQGGAWREVLLLSLDSVTFDQRARGFEEQEYCSNGGQDATEDTNETRSITSFSKEIQCNETKRNEGNEMKNFL
jgi:hypothetical protein